MIISTRGTSITPAADHREVNHADLPTGEWIAARIEAALAAAYARRHLDAEWAYVDLDLEHTSPLMDRCGGPVAHAALRLLSEAGYSAALDGRTLQIEVARPNGGWRPVIATSAAAAASATTTSAPK